MNELEGREFTDKEWAVLKVLFRSAIPLTIKQVTDEVKKQGVTIAWETCNDILKELHEEGFITLRSFEGKKKELWSLNYDRKKQLREKYKI